MRRPVFLLLFLTVSAGVHGATFTSVADGPWGDARTWGGEVPDARAGHVLVIATRVTLDGDVALGGGTELRLQPGAVLDLAGHTLALGAKRLDRVSVQFVGSEQARATVTSTKPGGAFVTGPIGRVSVQFERVDFSGLGDCRFGSRADADTHCRVRHSTFTRSGDLSFTFSGMPDANDLLFEHCDFRAPTGKQNYLLLVNCGGEAPTGRRTITHCTFDGEGKPAQVRTMVTNLTVEACVFEDAAWSSFTRPGQKVSRSFFHTAVHNCLVLISSSWNGDADVEDCYVFADGPNPHSVHMGDGKTVRGCVFEADDPECNHVIGGKAVTIERNIVLGTGTLYTNLSVHPGTVIVRNNTVYASKAGGATPMLILTEGRGNKFTGTCVARNNLLVDSDTTSENYGIGLSDPAPNQITSDGNCFYGYPDGKVAVPYYVWITRSRNPVDVIRPGPGGKDIIADPKFVDRHRNLAAWDKSLGGPGTSEHAIAELLKLNGAHDKRYTTDALINYIREGFTPTAPELEGIGAMPAKVR
ncbi:MAG TPA: hypothetical protein VMZ92_01155 [Planctomycetota bacterium]|nr:hypothetical protein [Planctomycetota bacterium]